MAFKIVVVLKSKANATTKFPLMLYLVLTFIITDKRLADKNLYIGDSLLVTMKHLLSNESRETNERRKNFKNYINLRALSSLFPDGIFNRIALNYNPIMMCSRDEPIDLNHH